jgi:hypothetical protein
MEKKYLDHWALNQRYLVHIWSCGKEIFRAAIIKCKAVLSCFLSFYAGNFAAVIGFIFQHRRSESDVLSKTLNFRSGLCYVPGLLFVIEGYRLLHISDSDVM